MVANQVIEKGYPGRSGHSQIANLDWRRPPGTDLHAMSIGVSVEINQNINAIFINYFGSISIALHEKRFEGIAVVLHDLGVGMAAAAAARIGHHAEPVAVVHTEQPEK